MQAKGHNCGERDLKGRIAPQRGLGNHFQRLACDGILLENRKSVPINLTRIARIAIVSRFRFNWGPAAVQGLHRSGQCGQEVFDIRPGCDTLEQKYFRGVRAQK